VLAAVVAVSPWPPTWGLWWVGVWALAVLSHPQVKAAFALGGRRADPAAPEPPRTRRPVLGGVGAFARSCARSFVGYFLPGFTRRVDVAPAPAAGEAAGLTGAAEAGQAGAGPGPGGTVPAHPLPQGRPF
jgi:hypothetical protein